MFQILSKKNDQGIKIKHRKATRISFYKYTIISQLKLLFLTLSVLYCYATSSAAETNNNNRAIILAKIAPLISQSHKHGENGKFYPDQITPPPFLWTRSCGDKALKKLLPKTKEACQFITAIKGEVTQAVCHDKVASYQTLWHLVKHYRGFVFSETQSLYLQSRAKALGLNTLFHEQAKQIMNLNLLDQSHEPQKMRRMMAALEKGHFKKAKTLLPTFANLCDNL